MASEPGEPCSVLLTDRPLLESSLEALHNADLTQAEQAVNTYCKTLDHYLELSTLLDPILNAHVITLCALTTARLEFFIANIPPTPDSPSHLAVELPCRALYGLIKVRGVKCVSPHLPHQVHNLRFLISALNAVLSQVYSDSFWHVRYILLVWLAVAIRAPFPIHTILQDSVVSEVVTHSQAALSAPGRVAIAAAVFLARLLARRDTLSHRISLLHWAVTHSLQLSAPSDTRIAGLSLLAATFKLAHRDDLQPHVQPVLYALAALAEAPATKVESHLITKLSQRVALAFLPPRPAAWRYRRNTRVILSRPCGHVGPVLEAEEPFVSEQDAEALEAVIDQLLTALQHRDTVVRWSAAKGIGRITARLPLPLARDVIYSVLDLFTNHDESRADACCHGACLALAELARRGLLLPSDPHFGMVFTAVKKAASFDVRRGASSIGSHVRDAACYVVWAMARVYSKEDIAPFASSITDSMLPVALLDREVNCRRAASAALQECVGRLSENLFMDGIQLITTADYFSLGDRSAVYLKISPKVSTLASGAYFDCITKDLWSKKLVHWDRGIRALAAKALARFVLIDKDSVILRDIIPKLVNFATQKGDMIFRHGAILGLAEVAAVAGREGLGTFSDEIRQIPISLAEKNMFTGRTGDDMRMACCHLIESLATKASGLYLESDTGREDAEQALEFLERILGCGEEHMYAAASSAYASICEHVIANDVSWHIKVTKRILNGISEGSFFEKQRGFSLAAGACGDSSMSGEVLAVLSQEITKNVDVEVRRNSATSLAALPKRVLREQVDDVLQSLVSGMADYATDDRGDVGSWVREASMISACKVIGIVFGEDLQNDKLPLDTASTKKLLMCVLHGIMRQCCSRIDRTRGVAGAALKSFCEFFTADCRDISLEMLCRDISYCFGFISNDQSSADTVSPEVIFIKSESVFPALEMALGISEISDAVLLGLVWAVGGTGHQSKMARKAVVQYFGSIKEESMKMAELQKVVQVIVDRDELLTIPAMQVIECLAKGGVFDNVDSRKLKDVAWIVRGSWRQRLRDVKRTCTAVHVLCELASLSSCDESFDFQGGSLGCECLEALAIVLGGPIPRLRRITADGIYMVLLEFDIDGFDSEDNCESSKIIEKVQASLKILSETRWEILSLSAAREQRNQLCRILEIRAPVIQSK